MGINQARILFQDEHFLAVNKLSGELVVRGRGEVGKLPLLDFLRKEQPGLRPLHRLDFETSGVVLFAKTKPAFEAALGKLTKGEGAEVPWTKTYRTLASGRMRGGEGEISKPLPARSGRGMVQALTRYRVLERFLRASYVEADIETGRHHQIRRHFAQIGHPLALDPIYGDRKYNRLFIQEFKLKRFFLHAFRLAFTHPFTSEPIKIEAPLPRPFEYVLQRLRELK